MQHNPSISVSSARVGRGVVTGQRPRRRSRRKRQPESWSHISDPAITQQAMADRLGAASQPMREAARLRAGPAPSEWWLGRKLPAVWELCPPRSCRDRYPGYYVRNVPIVRDTAKLRRQVLALREQLAGTPEPVQRVAIWSKIWAAGFGAVVCRCEECRAWLHTRAQADMREYEVQRWADEDARIAAVAAWAGIGTGAAFALVARIDPGWMDAAEELPDDEPDDEPEQPERVIAEAAFNNFADRPLPAGGDDAEAYLELHELTGWIDSAGTTSAYQVRAMLELSRTLLTLGAALMEPQRMTAARLRGRVWSARERAAAGVSAAAERSEYESACCEL
jgi:hypothetical protein